MTKELTIRESLKAQENNFANLLKATGTDKERFMNNAIMASSEIPEINGGEVSHKSVFNVCSRAANDGVVLDNREAAIVIGWNSKTRQKEAQYRLMAGGVMKMINRSPAIKHIACQLVYDGDDCVIDFVTDGQPVHHTINLRNRRGEVLGVYAVAKLATGEWTSPEYMSVEEINEVRDNFSAKNNQGELVSPAWKNSWGEMARKTVLHRIKKRLPLTEKAIDDLSKDGDFTQDPSVVETIEQEPAPKPKKNSQKAVEEAMQQAAQSTLESDDVPEADYEELPAEAYDEIPV